MTDISSNGNNLPLLLALKKQARAPFSVCLWCTLSGGSGTVESQVQEQGADKLARPLSFIRLQVLIKDNTHHCYFLIYSCHSQRASLTTADIYILCLHIFVTQRPTYLIASSDLQHQITYNRLFFNLNHKSPNFFSISFQNQGTLMCSDNRPHSCGSLSTRFQNLLVAGICSHPANKSISEVCHWGWDLAHIHHSS